jgi:SPP1 family predicted phage head-tail adaptor
MSTLSEHAGARGRRITFEQLRNDATLTDSGHLDETSAENWAPLANRWAEVWTRNSREFYRGEQVASHVTHKVKVRFDKQLWRLIGVQNASKFRIKLQANGVSRILNLEGPPMNENEVDEYISFPCVEQV